MNLTWLIFIGGLLHFGILFASAAVPQALDWRESLRGLDKLLRQLIWVHGAFIVMVIIGFGLLSLFLAPQLAAGTPLSRSVCLFIAVFWAARLLVQFFVFDTKDHLTSTFLKIGYHTLTVVFLYHVAVYGWVALAI